MTTSCQFENQFDQLASNLQQSWLEHTRPEADRIKRNATICRVAMAALITLVGVAVGAAALALGVYTGSILGGCVVAAGTFSLGIIAELVLVGYLMHKVFGGADPLTLENMQEDATNGVNRSGFVTSLSSAWDAIQPTLSTTERVQLQGQLRLCRVWRNAARCASWLQALQQAQERGDQDAQRYIEERSGVHGPEHDCLPERLARLERSISQYDGEVPPEIHNLIDECNRLVASSTRDYS